MACRRSLRADASRCIDGDKPRGLSGPQRLLCWNRCERTASTKGKLRISMSSKSLRQDIATSMEPSMTRSTRTLDADERELTTYIAKTPNTCRQSFSGTRRTTKHSVKFYHSTHLSDKGPHQQGKCTRSQPPSSWPAHHPDSCRHARSTGWHLS